MSVDSRLRQARPEDDARWEAGLELALEGVVRSARRRRTRHAAVAAGAVAAVLAVGGLAVGLGNDSDPSPAPTVPSPTTPTRITSLPRTSPLDSEWHTDRLDRQDVVTALVNAGTDPTVAAEFASGLPRGTFRYRMSIFRGLLEARVDHASPRFTQFLSVQDGSLTMTPGSPVRGHWTYDYSLDGDSLTFVMRGAPAGRFDGFSARVQGLAMFCVAPFIRTE